jgi:vancomycin resistance protein YoaR
MTSRTESFPSEYAAAPRYPWQRIAVAFALTLGALILFSAAFAWGYARMNDGRALPGVDVAGVDVAGLTRSAASAKLRASLPSLSTGELSIDVAGQTESIAYSDIDRTYDYDLMLDQAFSLGQADNFIEQLREQVAIQLNGMTVAPQVTWDNEALASRVASMVASAQVAPVDASISRQDGRYVVTPSSDGLSVDLEQAVAKAMTAVNNISPRSTSISIDVTPLEPSVATAEAQASASRADNVVGDGLQLSGGGLSARIDPEIIRGWVYLNEVALGDWHLSIAPEPIAQYLAALAAQTDVPPTNATFGFNGGHVTVIPSAEGRALDVEATTANVMAALESRSNGEDTGQVSLALAPVAPELDTAHAQALASRIELLGTWTTHYDPGPMNGGGVNIQTPTSIIDGQVVQPGEQFDFLTAIGPVTSPPYKEGGILIHGQIKEDGAIGGGMCSVSTTLFNAAMRAGLQIDERDEHSIYISRYPVGLDATVFEIGGHRQTMKFTNDTGYPIMIKGINARTTVTFEIYGIYDGRTVDLADAEIDNVVEGGAWLQYTDDLAPGQRRNKQDRYDSFDSVVRRVVRDSSGNPLHEDTWGSHYKKLDKITLVGRYPGDPPAGTMVRPDQYNPGGSPPPPPPDDGGNPPPPPPPPPDDGGNPPPAAPSAKFTIGGSGDTFSFTATGSGANHWTWTFSDGDSKNGQSVNKSFAPGTYTVTLTVSGPGGEASKSKSFTVAEPIPPPPEDPPDNPE